MTRIAFERPDQPEVIALIDELDAHQKPLYPPESHHGIDIEALIQPHVLFAVARAHDGAAVGCGAVVLNDGWGELKRMFVRPALRGQGVAQGILAWLEASVRERGFAVMRLETGVLQPEALRLYERAGYLRRGPFGDYGPDPLSVFMEKHLKA
jgi:putative acetyltransferase